MLLNMDDIQIHSASLFSRFYTAGHFSTGKQKLDENRPVNNVEQLEHIHATVVLCTQ